MMMILAMFDGNRDGDDYDFSEEVADKILEFKEEVGDFGTLLYAGHDWADVDLAKNSMKLMAEKVMPKINKHSKIAAE